MNCQRRYKYFVLGRNISYFVKKKSYSDSTKTFSVINMLVFLIDNIFVVWWTCVSVDSRHTYGYQLCSSSHWLVPLFIRGRPRIGGSQEKQKRLAESFNFTFRYIDDVISLNKSRFGDFVDRIYFIELTVNFDSRCRSRYEADISVSVVFFFKLNEIDAINEITKPRLI
jgi:hypothetical protein